MHGGAWYVKPSDNGVTGATPTWAVGTVDTDFPLANVLTLEPDVVAKANENTATLRLTYGVAKALKGVALMNVNFPNVAVQLTNNGGMTTQTVTAPNPEDNLQINLYFDLEDVASASATQWNVVVVGSAPVTIGTIVPIEAWSESRMRWDYDLTERFPVIEHRTGYQKRLQYRIPTRSRVYAGTPFYAADRNAMRTLRREAHGSMTPFLFLQDRNDEDIALVQFSGDVTERTTATFGLFTDDSVEGIVEAPITLEEVSSGIALL